MNTSPERAMDKIERLKQYAVELNEKGDQKELARVIYTLDQIWHDDAAAQRFYTQLEQAAS